MPAGTKKIAVTFKETMWGAYRMRDASEDKPFHFVIDAHAAEHPRDDWEITGTIHMPGFADGRPLLGSLTMPRGELRYAFRFMDNSGGVHRFLGSKYPNTKELLRSRTHIEDAAFYEEGATEPWATAKADFIGPWIPFFLSFQPIKRKQRPRGTKKEKNAAPHKKQKDIDRGITLAVAEAAFPGSEHIGPGDAALVERLSGFLRETGRARAGYNAMLKLLDLWPRISRKPKFSSLALEQRKALLDRWSRSRHMLPRLLTQSLIMPMKGLFMSSAEQHQGLGCQFGKEPVKPEPEPGWMQQVHPASGFDSDQLVDADVVVVGTGAGGAVAAKELAEKGLAVVMVESGAFYRRASFSGRFMEMLPRLYRYAGTSFSLGHPVIPIPMGNAVGGTTLINSGTCFRTPEEVLMRWVDEGLGDFSPEKMAPYFERVETILKVAPAERKVIGPIADIIGKGAEALGYKHGPLPRYAPDCTGEGVCQIGCSSDAKQSTNLSYVPGALKSGAVLFPEFQVRDILTDGERAVGVRGFGRGKNGNAVALTVLARAVVLSAGTLLTPVLIQRNGLCRGNRLIGANLSIHPCSGCSAYFPGIDMQNGKTIPQGYGVTEFRKEGILFEGGTLNLEAYSPTGPLLGRDYMAHLEAFAHMAFFGFMVDDLARGFVRPGIFGRPFVYYSMTGEDVLKMARALAILSRIFLAAGAEWVSMGTSRTMVARSLKDVEDFWHRTYKARDFSVSAFHPLGTARIGVDPKRSAADAADHQLHQVPGLFVVDGSAVPSSVGVNPMITIMALATRAAERIAEKLS